MNRGSFSNQRNGYGECEGQQFSESDSDGIQQPHKDGKIKKLTVVVLAVTALFATVLFCNGFSAVSTVAVRHDDDIFMDLQEVSNVSNVSNDSGVEEPKIPDPEAGKKFMPCDGLVAIKKPALVASNLGGFGPDDTKPEGMRYNTTATISAGGNATTISVGIEINAIGNYTGGDAYKANGHNAFNGIHGKFLSILILSGTSLEINVSVTDLDTGLPLLLPYFAITFFDLDTSAGGESKEYVEADGIEHFYIYKDSEVEVESRDKDSKVFSASKMGTGHDNPKDPDQLTIAQKKKGVTLQYLHKSSAHLTLGAREGGKTHPDRGFTFTLRPSLLCSDTVLEDGTIVEPGPHSILQGVDWPLMDGKKPTPYMEVPHVVMGPNGTIIIDDKNDKKAGASVQSGTKALLLAMTMVAVTWPRGDLR